MPAGEENTAIFALRTVILNVVVWLVEVIEYNQPGADPVI